MDYSSISSRDGESDSDLDSNGSPVDNCENDGDNTVPCSKYKLMKAQQIQLNVITFVLQRELGKKTFHNIPSKKDLILRLLFAMSPADKPTRDRCWLLIIFRTLCNRSNEKKTFILISLYTIFML